LKTLLKEYLIKGTYSIILEGKDLAAGNYYLQIITDKGQLSKQFLKY